MKQHMPRRSRDITMPRKVLVVGASGFIGRSVSKTLISEGFEIHGVARTQPDLNFADFTNSRSHEITELKSGEYDAVVYAAGKLRPSSKVDSLIKDVFPETMEVLRFAELCEAIGVKKFIMISSGGTIYGEGGGAKKIESDNLRPVSPYGYMHLMVDKGLSQISRRQNMQTVCLRIANVYGPGQNTVEGQGLIPAIRNCVVAEEVFTIRGDGTSVRDYVFIDDVVEAIRLTLGRENLPLAINIGSARGMSVNDVFSIFQEQIDKPIKVANIQAHSAELKEIVLDITLAQKTLGWTPKVELKQGVQSFLQHHPLT